MELHPPFTDSEGLLRFIRGTRARKKDIMIGNEGREGTGKSTTAMNIARQIDPDFDIRENQIKDVDHLLQVLLECRMEQLFVLDESVNIFHNHDWNTVESKGLTKILRQMRIMRSCWILNQPDFDGLHPYVRNERIPIRIYHPPCYDADGLGNGPSQVYFKHEWFNWQQQEVTRRWQLVIDELHVPGLDGDKDWEQYEQDKIDNFKAVVKQVLKLRESKLKKAKK